MSNEDYKQALIAAIRAGGTERDRAFRFFEEKLADSFKGEPGFKFYDDLMAIVKEADPEAVEEYRKRFAPLLDQDLLGKQLLGAYSDALAREVAEKETAILTKGGEPAVLHFLNRAAEYRDKHPARLREWLDFAIPLLPEKDRHAVVEMLVRAAKPK